MYWVRTPLLAPSVRREARGDGGYDMEFGESSYIPLFPACLSLCAEPRSHGNPRQRCSRLSPPTNYSGRQYAQQQQLCWPPTRSLGLVHRGLPSIFGFPITRSSPSSMGRIFTLVAVCPLFRPRRKSLSRDSAPHSDGSPVTLSHRLQHPRTLRDRRLALDDLHQRMHFSPYPLNWDTDHRLRVQDTRLAVFESHPSRTWTCWGIRFALLSVLSLGRPRSTVFDTSSPV
jgi:hypothetical protein